MNDKRIKTILKESLCKILSESNESDDILAIISSVIPNEDILKETISEDYYVFVLSKKFNNPFSIMKLTMLLKEHGYTCKASGNINGTLSLYVYNY